ncbi:MAG: FAD-binding protein [Nanoarchaeota archaeon]
MNTSSLSFGHCRVPKKEGLERIIRESVEKLGEDENRMRFIYSNAGLVINLLDELKVNFEYRSFGVIPLGKKRGGRLILEKLQENIPFFETETELIDFSKSEGEFILNLKKRDEEMILKTKYLVLGTGGYGGKFPNNDNFRYNSYNIFDIVRENNGNIINTNSIFIHPFGYNKGKNIFIGNEVKEGRFIDSNNNPVFDERVGKLIKDNNYHEFFKDVLEQIKICKDKGLSVYFDDGKRKLEICPTVHYTPGGINTDYFGKVIGCENLYAIGECKADGLKNGGRFSWLSIYLCYCECKISRRLSLQNFINHKRLDKL